MKQNKRRRKTDLYSYSVRIFIFCLLPLFVMQVVLYCWSSSVVKEEITSTASTATHYLSSMFSDQVSAVDTEIQRLLRISDVRDLFVYFDSLTPSEYSRKVNQILSHLHTIRSTSPLIQDVNLYYPRLGISVASRPQNEGVFKYDPLVIQSRINQLHESKTTFQYYDGQFAVCFASSISSNSQLLPAYYVEITLSSQAVKEFLSTFSVPKDKIAFLYSHTANVFLTSEPSTLAAEQLREKSIIVNGTSYTVFSEYAVAPDSTFGHLILEDNFERIPRILMTFMVAFVSLVVLVVCLFCQAQRRNTIRPIKDLIAAFDATSVGKFDVRLSHKPILTEYQSLFNHYNRMNEQISCLIAENYESVMRLQRAELKQLQAQINPHFLYNSFFLLRHTLQAGDQESAMQFLDCMRRYFQYISDNNVDSATLKEEYDHACNYLFIQSMRFEDILELDIEPLPKELETEVVPKLIVQPLIENIMVHSRWNSMQQRVIRMRFVQDQKYLKLILEDNGQDVTDEKLSEIQDTLSRLVPINECSGLVNINQRIRLYYHTESGLSVSRSTLSGFCVTLMMTKGGGHV